MASSFNTVESVTTKTFFAPKCLKSIPTSFVQPGPKRMDDAAISKAYSFCWLKSTGVASDRTRPAYGLWLWWWPGFEWHGHALWVELMVRRRLKALVAREGAILVIAIVVDCTEDWSSQWECRPQGGCSGCISFPRDGMRSTTSMWSAIWQSILVVIAIICRGEWRLGAFPTSVCPLL